MKSFISYKQPIIIPDSPIATVPQGVVVPSKAVTEVRRKGSAGQRKGERRWLPGPREGAALQGMQIRAFLIVF